MYLDLEYFLMAIIITIIIMTITISMKTPPPAAAIMYIVLLLLSLLSCDPLCIGLLVSLLLLSCDPLCIVLLLSLLLLTSDPLLPDPLLPKHDTHNTIKRESMIITVLKQGLASHSQSNITMIINLPLECIINSSTKFDMA